MFTAGERAYAARAVRDDEYFATRFAVKEAVFKAVAHLLDERFFDYRLVETLNREDGLPVVTKAGQLGAVLIQAGVKNLHVSITTQDDYATAFVIAEGD